MGTGDLYEGALAANRNGRLSDAQQRQLEAGVRARHTGITGLVGRHFDSRLKDVEAGAVQSIEGAITKQTRQVDAGGGLPGLRYYINVANRQDGVQRYRCIGELFEYAPEAGFVRLYFLPRSRWAVNVERIDGPAADATPADLERAAATFKEARHARDRVGQAEALAGLEAIKEAATGPPPSSVASSEPLGRALLGSWRSPLMRLGLELRDDGWFTAQLPDGSTHQGRWSLDGTRLSAQIPGSPIQADAAVLGGRLILTMDGQSLAFERAA